MSSLLARKGFFFPSPAILQGSLGTSFSETPVQTASSGITNLRRTEGSGTDQADLLIFMKFKRPTIPTTSTPEFFRFAAGSGLSFFREQTSTSDVDLQVDQNGGAQVCNRTVGSGTGIFTANQETSVLIYVNASSGNTVVNVNIWDGKWNTDLDTTTVNNTGTIGCINSVTWDLNARSPTLWGQPPGIIWYRFAVWSGVYTGAPADFTQSTQRDRFIDSSSGALTDPADSRSTFGTPLFDFEGAAASCWNVGKPAAGSFGTFSVTGSFSDV